MPRRPRASTSGLIFHVLNRAAKRAPLFEQDADFLAFERVLSQALRRFRIALYAYSLMSTHWHLVLSPSADGVLSRFMHWLTTTHARRWHLARGLDGSGAVYQGRFKAIPVSCDRHFLWVCRYVERNALRANLVSRAEAWRWCSLAGRNDEGVRLSEWPVPRPHDWIDHVNRPQTAGELDAFRRAMREGTPFGDVEWRESTMRQLGLVRPRRSRGRQSRVMGSVLVK